MKKKLLGSMLLGISVMLGCASPAMADSRKVVTLGADLSQDQKDTMMRYFGQSYDSVDIIYINNQDERNYLGAYVPLEQIGSHTYSCALVAPTSTGGIQVKTANLEWVTCNIIASTLSTSGVTNCQVVAACPFKVSGTGALTGVIMAYQNASNQTLDPVKVELANQELVTTGNLANEVGQSKATAVINETKLEVIENNVTDINEIVNIVNNVSSSFDVTINEEQSDEIAGLMQKIAEQEYDITQLKATLDRVQANVIGDAGASEEEQEEAAQRAKASEEAAQQAAEQQAAEAPEQTELPENTEGVVIADGNAQPTSETESILDNTDPSALEQGGTPIEEVDTTKTVQEQSEAQTETDEWGAWDVENQTFGGDTTEQSEAVVQPETTAPEGSDGSVQLFPEETSAEGENSGSEELIPEATEPAAEGDGSVELLPGEGAPENAESEPQEQQAEPAPQEEQQQEQQTEPAAEEQPEPEYTESDLSDADRETYTSIRDDMEMDFSGGVVTSMDGSMQVYLTEDAAEALPEKIDKYILNVMVKGAQTVADEEAADPNISQTIMEDTMESAPDKNYEDDQVRQIDKYVRRVVFKDSEKLLADSQLEDSDKTVLYNVIMGAVENAYGIVQETEAPLPEEVPMDDNSASEEVPVQEEIPAPQEEIPQEEAAPEEIPAEEAAPEEIPAEEAAPEEAPAADDTVPMEEGAADEFADFEVETGSF